MGAFLFIGAGESIIWGLIVELGAEVINDGAAGFFVHGFDYFWAAHDNFLNSHAR